MIRAELKGLFSRKLRTILTMVAIILGVSMISGTFILTDTINQAFNDIFAQANQHIAAVVTGQTVVGSEDARAPTVSASLLRIVQSAKGVKAADGEIADSGSLFAVGPGSVSNGIRKELGSTRGPPTFIFGVGDQRFNELTKISGSWPTSNQVALDEDTMSRNDLTVGDKVGIATDSHPLETFTISAETKFGTESTVGGATLMELDLKTAQRMTGNVGQFNQIKVMSEPGFTQQQVVANIKHTIPAKDIPSVKVATAKEHAKDQSDAIANALNFVTIALLAFGGIAVFVGAFIIFNTFSITVAQRAREFALLRTIGASRGQVLRAVIMEAFLIGLVASIIGLIAGLGIAKGLNGLFKAIGADLPQTGLVIEQRTIVVGLMVGTVVTLLAGMVPAIRATRVPPIAALREGAVLPKSRFSRFTPYIAALLGLFGLACTLYGVFAAISDTNQRLLLIAFGCVVLFIGVAMFSPQLVRPLASALGWPMERFSRITGRLARENATRNPSRTATTAAALMIGLALVGFVTIFAAELKATASDAVDREVAGTYIIQGSGRGSAVQKGAIKTVESVPGVAVASAVKQGPANLAGIGEQDVNGIDPKTFGQVYRFQWKTGSSQVVMSMKPYDAIIADDFASSNHLEIGSTISLLTPANIHATFTVRGIFKSSELLESVVITNRTFGKAWRQPNADVLVVNARPGVDQTKLENLIVAKLQRHYPTLSVDSQAQFKQQTTSGINTLLTLVYVLLGLSIIVSLFGIINTLVLSIFERTREIGMLRAIGTTRSQIRWMIRWESIITALIGAILGLGLGIVLAAIVTTGLKDQGIVWAFPIGQLLIWVAVAIVFGLVAAAFPARRAARLDVLKAVSYE